MLDMFLIHYNTLVNVFCDHKDNHVKQSDGIGLDVDIWVDTVVVGIEIKEIWEWIIESNKYICWSIYIPKLIYILV